MSTRKAYSVDLRERVIAMANGGTPLKAVAALFKVNVKTIYNWRQQFKETGSFAPKTGYQKGHGKKIVDLEAFKIFVEENSDLTLKEMGAKFGGVSQQTIMRGMRNINFTFKKNNSAMQNVMKKKEQNFKKKFRTLIHQ